MTVLQALRGGLGQPRAESLENPQVPITSASVLQLFGLQPTVASKSVTERSSLGMSAVWRAVNLIAGTCASLPLHAYKADGPARVRATGAGAALLEKPHPDLTPMELWELGYASILTWGNAYYFKVFSALGVLKELWWINPARVRAGRATDGTKVYEVDGGEHVLTDSQVLHIPGMSVDGIVGLSPIRVAREGIGLSLAAEEFGARMFGSGMLTTGILTTDQEIDQDDADRIKARWKAGGTGLASAHDIRVIGSGAKYQQLSLPPQDAQFVETRRFQIEEVARIFGIPPHMLGETAKSTSWGTGLEEQTLGFLTYTLRPWLTRFEQRISKIIGPETVYARYSVEGLLRSNSQARAAYYRQLWELGVLSTNDIRALEEMAPIDGGDARYVPLNFGLLGDPDPAAAQPPEGNP